jgi:hypothetical protein
MSKLDDLRTALAEYRTAADGPSGDDEHAAAERLADAASAVLPSAPRKVTSPHHVRVTADAESWLGKFGTFTASVADVEVQRIRYDQDGPELLWADVARVLGWTFAQTCSEIDYTTALIIAASRA